MSRLLVVTVMVTILSGMLNPTALSQPARPSEVKMGVFTFMSGPAAAYGMPAKNAADLLFDDLNRRGGIAGVPIRPIFVDEAQGTAGVVADFRRLVTAERVEVTIGALSSSHCLAMTPVAEELRTPMIMWNCDSHQVFMNRRFRYAFRTNSNTIPEFMAYALYLLHKKPDVKQIAIINPDYAFGHDAALIFKETVRRLRPDVQVVVELFPRLGQPGFHTEISRLLGTQADVIFSNLWGADLVTFMNQALPRGLFRDRTVVLALGEFVLERFGRDFPEGVIVGVLGDGYHSTPTSLANAETQRLVRLYRERFREAPVFPSFKMMNTILAVKTMYERALERTGGRWPTSDDLVEALRGAEVKNFTGTLRMRDDNDGLVDQVVGIVRHVPTPPFAVMAEMVRYPAELITPPVFPVGFDPIRWIRALPPEFFGRLPKPGSYR